LLSLLALLLLLPEAARALPAGGGSLSLFFRQTRQDTDITRPTLLDESLLRLDLFQTVPGYGRLFSSADLSRTDEENSLSRFQLGLEGFRLGRWTHTLIAGDTAVRFSNLVQGFAGPHLSLHSVMPPLPFPFAAEESRFVNTTYPDIYFRGGALHSTAAGDAVTLFGGRLADLQGFQANEYEVTETSLYGLKWRRRFGDGSYGGIGFGAAGGEEEGAPGGPQQRNSILLLDGAWRLAPAVRLVGEYRESLFRRDEQDGSDRAFRIGPMLAWEKGRLEANYRYAGPDFVLFRQSLQPERDVKGLFAMAEYRPLGILTLYTSLDWNRNNLDDDPARPSVHTVSALLGGYLYPPRSPAFNLRLSVTDRNSADASSTTVENRTYSAYLETVKQFAKATPYLRLTGERSEDEILPESSARTGTVVAGVRLFPAPLLSFYLEGEEQLREVDNGDTTSSIRARGGLNLIPRPWLSLYADAQYAHTRDKPAGTTQESVSASAGTLLTLPRQYLLGGNLRYTENEADNTVESASSSLQVEVRLTKRFGWGDPGPAPLPGAAGQLALASVGQIEGFIFQDFNRNGRKESDEPGIPAIAVILEDGTTTRSDADGRFRFSNIPAGIHLVRIDERLLPVEFNLLGSPGLRTEVALRKTAEVFFPLLISGEIRGRVLLDANGNGLADAGDEPLGDALVYLAGTSINAFTDADGNFSLANILPGVYELKIDPVWLPEGVQLVSPDTLPLQLRSGETIDGVAFLARRGSRTVIKKVFGQTEAAPPEKPAPAGKTTGQPGATAPSTPPLQKRQKPAPPAARPRSDALTAMEVREVRFRFNSSHLASSADRAVLQEVAALLQRNPDWVIDIEGHSDRQGDESYNHLLGLKRAAAVAGQLQALGVAEQHISNMLSHGSRRPVCTEEAISCHRQNRRVTIRLLGR
jgi:outer membrane protein OmpA-like peptidoglycan-associated protein